MAANTIEAATQATGVVDGLEVYAGGSTVKIGEGLAYFAGLSVCGGWQFDCSGLRGWQFAQLSPSGPIIGPCEFEGAIALAAILFDGGRAVALRDVRQSLHVEEWDGDSGSVCWSPPRSSVIVRAQGASFIDGAWETSRCFCQFKPGRCFERHELVCGPVTFDKAGLRSALVIETIAIT